ETAVYGLASRADCRKQNQQAAQKSAELLTLMQHLLKPHQGEIDEIAKRSSGCKKESGGTAAVPPQSRCRPTARYSEPELPGELKCARSACAKHICIPLSWAECCEVTRTGYVLLGRDRSIRHVRQVGEVEDVENLDQEVNALRLRETELLGYSDILRDNVVPAKLGARRKLR